MVGDPSLTKLTDGAPRVFPSFLPFRRLPLHYISSVLLSVGKSCNPGPQPNVPFPAYGRSDSRVGARQHVDRNRGDLREDDSPIVCGLLRVRGLQEGQLSSGGNFFSLLPRYVFRLRTCSRYLLTKACESLVSAIELDARFRLFFQRLLLSKIETYDSMQIDARGSGHTCMQLIKYLCTARLSSFPRPTCASTTLPRHMF